MKIAILSESRADEAAIAILVKAALGHSFELEPLNIRKPPRGWTHVLEDIPKIIKHLYYHTHAEGLIIVLDSNHSPYHQLSHVPSENPKCRWCKMRCLADYTMRNMKKRADKYDFKVALGLTANSIESWFLNATELHYTESAWLRQDNKMPSTRQKMKEILYGTVWPDLELATRIMIEKATSIASDLDRFEQAFPIGFGVLREELKKWAASCP